MIVRLMKFSYADELSEEEKESLFQYVRMSPFLVAGMHSFKEGGSQDVA